MKIFTPIIKAINTLFRTADKSLQVTESVVDVANANVTLWKIEASKEIQKELKGTNLQEINTFYDDLYR